jgi:hypothetical protein
MVPTLPTNVFIFFQLNSPFSDEQVKEALAAELVPVIWWFFTVRKFYSALPP